MLFERVWVETKILNISFCLTVILPIKKKKENPQSWTSLAVQWLRFHTSNAGDKGLIPGQAINVPHGT